MGIFRNIYFQCGILSFWKGLSQFLSGGSKAWWDIFYVWLYVASWNHDPVWGKSYRSSLVKKMKRFVIGMKVKDMWCMKSHKLPYKIWRVLCTWLFEHKLNQIFNLYFYSIHLCQNDVSLKFDVILFISAFISDYENLCHVGVGWKYSIGWCESSNVKDRGMVRCAILNVMWFCIWLRVLSSVRWT